MEVSVIIPVYNAERFIERAVRSALSQPETGEVLLIDDASTDGSWTICQQLANENAKVKLFQHEDRQNHGPGATRNIGLKNAACDFIAFLDADDYYVEGRFKTAKKVFGENESVDGVYEPVLRFFLNEVSRIRYVESFGNTVLYKFKRNTPPDEVFETSVLDQYSIIHLNGLVLKKTIFQKVSYFDESFIKCEDYDWIWRVSNAVSLYPGKYAKPVAKSCIHGGNIVLDHSQSSSMRYLLYKKWFKKSLKNNWSRRINRFLLNHYLYYHPILAKYKEIAAFRISFKFVAVSILMIRFPVLIVKLMK